MSVLLGEQRAADLPAAPGELRDDRAPGAHRDVVDTVAADPAALDRLGDEDIPEAGRGQEPDVARGRDRAAVVGVAREGESGVREREREPAVPDRVTVHHVRADSHPHRGPSGPDRDEIHAQGPAGLVGGPHRLGRETRGLLRRPHSGFSISDTTWPSAPSRPTSTYPRPAWKASDAWLGGSTLTSSASRPYGAAT